MGKFLAPLIPIFAVNQKLYTVPGISVNMDVTFEDYEDENAIQQSLRGDEHVFRYAQRHKTNQKADPYTDPDSYTPPPQIATVKQDEYPANQKR